MSRHRAGKFKNKYEDFKIDEAFASKAWYTRKLAYETVAGDFGKPDPRGRNWDVFTHAVKALMAERNVPAQEKGLEAVLAFVTNCSIVDDNVIEEVLNYIVNNGLSHPKSRIRDLSQLICMKMYDRKKHELVTAALLKGVEGGNGKQAMACIRTLTNALRTHGPAWFNIAAVATKIVTTCRDKAMFQQDVKDILIEMYKWNRTDITDILDKLDVFQRKAMEIEFVRMDRMQAESSMFPAHNAPSIVPRGISDFSPITISAEERLRSEANKKLPALTTKAIRPSSASHVANSPQRFNPSKSQTCRGGTTSKRGSNQGCGDRSNRRNQPCVKKMDLEDILINMENRQWAERKEAVERLCELICSNTEICGADFGKIIKRLRVLILEDTNVVLVSKAVKCVTTLAEYRGKEFQQHVPLMMTLLLEKFKDKKSVVTESLREAIDAIYSGFHFGSIARYVALSLLSQNPRVKAETAFFIQRCFSKPTPVSLKQNHWEPLVQGLVNNLAFPDQTVRENSMRALGTMMSAFGDTLVLPYMSKIPKHQMSSILKYTQNAETAFPRPISRAGTETSVESELFDSKVNSLLPGFKKISKADYSSESDQSAHDEEPSHQTYVHKHQTAPGIPAPSNRTMKSLSPGSRQKLADFKNMITQLKSAWIDVKPPIPPNPIDSAQEKISRKLEALEGNVTSCFIEVRKLCPDMYRELERSSSPSRGDFIQTLNLKLSHMERIMKSMTFAELRTRDSSTFDYSV